MLYIYTNNSTLKKKYCLDKTTLKKLFSEIYFAQGLANDLAGTACNHYNIGGHLIDILGAAK